MSPPPGCGGSTWAPASTASRTAGSSCTTCSRSIPAASDAEAAANAQIKVTLGGYTEFFAAIYDNNLVNGTDREFQLETEIVVRADGKADNGLLYGAKVELQNGTTASVGTVGTTSSGSIGAGGAIVADSTAEAEHEEVLLKARGLRRALARADGTARTTTAPPRSR